MVQFSGPRGKQGAVTAALLACGVLLAAAPAAHAVPRVLSAKLGAPPKAGAAANLVIGATDPEAPATTMVAKFGGNNGLFGLAACRDGLAPSGPFRAGARNRLTAPHVYSGTNARQILVRVQSSSCSARQNSVAQPLKVTPVRPGQKPAPVELGTPVPVGPDVVNPVLDLPDLPPLPYLAGLPLLSRGPTATAAARCRGANRRPGRSRRARSRARKAILCLVNGERRRAGLRGLRTDPRLRRAAVGHSRSMVLRAYFSHVQPGGTSLSQRLRRSRYITRRVSWIVAENLAYGTGSQSTPAVMVRAWMNSAPHRANILTGSFRELGTGIVRGVPGRPRAGFTYTSNFGRRR